MKIECKLISFDKTVLQYTMYQGPKKGLPIILIHGASEHGARYEGFATYLVSRGFDVVVPDLRGYGRSGGNKASINKFDDYSTDIKIIMAAVQKRFGYHNERFGMIAHSMGSLVALKTVLDVGQSSFFAICLSSPCLGLSFKIPLHMRVAANILSKIAPNFLFKTNSMPIILTHDEQQIQLRENDTLITPFMSARLFCQMQTAMQDVMSDAKDICLPLAVFQAGDDRVVNGGLAPRLVAEVASVEKMYKEYPGLFHEILHETNRHKIWAEFASWLLKHVPTERCPA